MPWSPGENQKDLDQTEGLRKLPGIPRCITVYRPRSGVDTAHTGFSKGFLSQPEVPRQVGSFDALVSPGAAAAGRDQPHLRREASIRVSEYAGQRDDRKGTVHDRKEPGGVAKHLRAAGFSALLTAVV